MKSQGTMSSLQWGRDHEATALIAFTKEHNLTTTPAGIFLFECGFLGATPDALVEAVFNTNSTPFARAYQILIGTKYYFVCNVVFNYLS